jgi:hypothetical protein
MPFSLINVCLDRFMQFAPGQKVFGAILERHINGLPGNQEAHLCRVIEPENDLENGSYADATFRAC